MTFNDKCCRVASNVTATTAVHLLLESIDRQGEMRYQVLGDLLRLNDMLLIWPYLGVASMLSSAATYCDRQSTGTYLSAQILKGLLVGPTAHLKGTREPCGARQPYTGTSATGYGEWRLG